MKKFTKQQNAKILEMVDELVFPVEDQDPWFTFIQWLNASTEDKELTHEEAMVLEKKMGF